MSKITKLLKVLLACLEVIRVILGVLIYNERTEIKRLNFNPALKNSFK